MYEFFFCDIIIVILGIQEGVEYDQEKYFYENCILFDQFICL